MSDEQYQALSAELEAELLRELSKTYDRENWARFGERMKRPVIVLSEAASHLGRWIRTTRTIELARKLVLGRPWLEVTSVLEHEMAHQFVDEVLRIHDESAHGETFRRVCAERGIDGRAAGLPATADAPTPATVHALDRIRKLLALAGSSNQHEAELAMKKAHELMLRHNIEETRVLETRAFEVRHLGDPEERDSSVEAAVVGLLTEFFFVEAIRLPVYLPRSGKRGTVYEIAGTPANVEMAAHVYAFLLATAERLWQENRRDARVKSGRDRIAYQAGVVGGFRERLLLGRVTLEREEGLVWVGDRKLEEFYRTRHPRTQARRRTVRLNGAHAAGREAGRKVVLNKPVANGPSSGGPRLLRG